MTAMCVIGRTLRTVGTALALTGGALLLGGCHGAPQSVALFDTGGETQVAVWSGEYWNHEVATSSDASRAERRAPDGPKPGDRVIVSEFAVEFVQEKFETPFESQLAAAPATPISIGIAALGGGRVQIDFEPEDYQPIATRVYTLFVDELSRQGLTVVPHEQGAECDVFSTLLSASAEAEPNVLQKFNAFATDTGRIKEMRTVAPEGMVLLNRNGPVTLLEAERSVLEKTGADWVIRATFRVGIYREHLSVEQDSRIVATSAKKVGSTKSRRSLLSPDPAVDPKEFEAFRGDVFRIDTTRFLGALDRTMPVYARMGVIRAGGDD